MTITVPAMLRIGEGDGQVEVCVTLSAAEDTKRSLIVTLRTNDDTGITTINKYCSFIIILNINLLICSHEW